MTRKKVHRLLRDLPELDTVTVNEDHARIVNTVMTAFHLVTDKRFASRRADGLLHITRLK